MKMSPLKSALSKAKGKPTPPEATQSDLDSSATSTNHSSSVIPDYILEVVMREHGRERCVDCRVPNPGQLTNN